MVLLEWGLREQVMRVVERKVDLMAETVLHMVQMEMEMATAATRAAVKLVMGASVTQTAAA